MSKRSKSPSAARPRARRTVEPGYLEQVLAGVALIVGLTTLAYLPCLRGEFIFDDYANLTNNKLVRAADGPYRFWFTTEAFDYWPVFNTTLWLEWNLWGTSPTGYHVVNLFLHIATALLLWLVLQRLNVRGSFLAALLFAVHPVNVESVAWITQLKNLLALSFCLLSVLCYLSADTSTPAHPTKLRRWYAASLAAFVLAMLSKGSVVLLPLILLGIVWWSRWPTTQDLRRLTPFALISAVLLPVNIWFQSRMADDAAPALSLVERLLGAAAALWFYLEKALLPLELSFVYPRWQVRADDPRWWLPLLAAAALTLVLWYQRRGWGRPALFAWGYFCLSLVPVLGFTTVAFMRYSPVADHYQHAALIGPIALAAAGWATWRRRAATTARTMSTAVAIVVVAVLTVLTWQQSALYASGEKLYRDTLRKNPDAWLAHNNLGAILADGDPQEAIAHLERALQLDPDYAEAHGNLGALLAKTGRVEEAIEHYEQELRLKPDSFNGHYNLGLAFRRQSRPQEAVTQLRLATRLDPDYPAAHYNLGLALVAAGDSQAAIESFRAALRLEPNHAQAHNDLGVVLTGAGQLQEAIGHFQHALRLAPALSDALYNLEVARAMEKGAAEANRIDDESAAPPTDGSKASQ